MASRNTTLVAAALLIGAFLLFRGGGARMGNLVLRTPGRTGTLYVNGKKSVATTATGVVTVQVPSGEPLVLRVAFDDGTESAERTLTLAAGQDSKVQIFLPVGVSLAQESYTAQSERLAIAGDTARATAVSMLADAHNLLAIRKYDEASAKYAEVVATYPGTPEAKVAKAAKIILDLRMSTAAGRAALDRANPLR